MDDNISSSVVLNNAVEFELRRYLSRLIKVEKLKEARTWLQDYKLFTQAYPEEEFVKFLFYEIMIEQKINPNKADVENIQHIAFTLVLSHIDWLQFVHVVAQKMKDIEEFICLRASLSLVESTEEKDLKGRMQRLEEGKEPSKGDVQLAIAWTTCDSFYRGHPLESLFDSFDELMSDNLCNLPEEEFNKILMEQ